MDTIRIKVEPTFKKSVEERELWYNPTTRQFAEYTTGWRWGTYYIDIDPAELEDIKLKGEREQGIEITAYEDWELDSCWDQCWGGWATWKMGEGQDEEFAEELEEMEDAYMWLEINGFQQEDLEVEFFGGFTVKVVED